MTLIVVGILAVVVLPRLDLIAGIQESGFRDQLQSSLDYARKAAIAARRVVCVNLAVNPLQFVIDTREPDAPAPAFGATAACSGATAVALPMPDKEVRVPAGLGLTTTAAVNFDALGRPVDKASASLAPLAASPTITIVGTSPPISLTVAAGTGLIR